MMKNRQIKTILFSIVTTLALLTSAYALDDNKPKKATIIVHKSNSLSSISKEELSNIFLGKKVLWESGNRIVAGMISTDNDQIKVFLKHICNKSVKRFNAHWMKFIFSGSGIRPQEFSSSMNASYFVGSNKNSIAIVDAPIKSNNVKILKVVN